VKRNKKKRRKTCPYFTHPRGGQENKGFFPTHVKGKKGGGGYRTIGDAQKGRKAYFFVFKGEYGRLSFDSEAGRKEEKKGG